MECGEPLPGDAGFCLQCGSAVTDTEPERGLTGEGQSAASRSSAAQPGDGATISAEMIEGLQKQVESLEEAGALGGKKSPRQSGALGYGAEPAATGMGAQSEIQVLARAANDAAAFGDWGTAVEKLRAAIRAAGSDAPPDLKKGLAVCLANQATEKVNRAVEMLNEAGRQREAHERGHVHQWRFDQAI